MREIVFESLNNAVENGFDMADMAIEQIAIDLCTYDADLEGIEPDELIPHIEAWMEVQGT